MKKRPFTSRKGNIPKFPYSQAVIFGDLIFISAQPPVNPETDQISGEDVASQTRCILTNIKGILEDAGTSLENVLKVTVILKDRSLFAEFNAAYAAFFPENPPARTPIFSDTGSYLVLMDVVAGMA
jgi:2-iminobutanoate/2-iminopropanoate deaminase